MKSSFIILCCFITGILLAYYRYVPDIFLTYDYSNYILPVMMFFVGIGIGGDIKSLYVPIKKYKLKIILIPLATIFGSIIITALISPLFDITTKETIAIGSGFGYYSLSAIFLNKLAGYEIGMMALISNMTREITALLFYTHFSSLLRETRSYFCGRGYILSTRHYLLLQKVAENNLSSFLYFMVSLSISPSLLL